MAASSLFRGPPLFAPATRWPVLGAVLAGFGIVAVSVVVGGAAYVGCLVHEGVPLTQYPATPADGTILCQLGGVIGQEVMFAALALFAAGFFASSRRDALALGLPRRNVTFVTAVLLMVPPAAAYTLLVWLLSPADLVRDLSQLLPIIRSDMLWLALLAISVGAPVSEELLFRGFLLPALARSRLGFAGAALLTTAAWTALHFSYSVYGLLEVFLIGLYFSWLLWRTGSLWLPIVCHAVYNTTVLLALRYLPLPL